MEERDNIRTSQPGAYVVSRLKLYTTRLILDMAFPSQLEES